MVSRCLEGRGEGEWRMAESQTVLARDCGGYMIVWCLRVVKRNCWIELYGY